VFCELRSLKRAGPEAWLHTRGPEAQVSTNTFRPTGIHVEQAFF
jgi:hypothetical protein